LNYQRKRVAKRLASGLLAGAVAFGGLAISGSSPAGAVPVELDSRQRLAGEDRYETSALVAEELEDQLDALGDEVTTVVVANGENFPDALAASALAGSSAPILLVKSASIPNSVLQRMGRLSSTVEDVYVIGGTSAVSESVFAQIEDVFDDADVERLSGDDRYATALAVADEVGNDAAAVLIASGTGFADAVSVGSYAAANGYPILLAGPSGLDADTVAWIEAAVEDEDLARAIIIGGPAAVSAGVEDQLAEAGIVSAGISRVAGPDRYLTNLLWNLEEFSSQTAKHLGSDSPEKSASSIMLVSGAAFPDALAAAPLAAQLGAHVVLTDPASGGASWLTLAPTLATPATSDIAAAVASFASLADGAQQYSASYGTMDLWVVGGTSAVPAAVVTAGETAAAGAAVTCSVTVAGGNSTGGPTSAVVTFSNPLQRTVSGAAIAAVFGAGDALSSFVRGEEYYFETSSNFAGIYSVDGTTVSSATAADYNFDGFKETIALVFADALSDGDVVEFKGVDQDADDYGDTVSVSSAHPIETMISTFLRDFDSCEAEVAEDETGPTASIYPYWDTTSGAQEHVVHIRFSEALADVGYLSYYTDLLEADVSNSAAAVSAPAASTPTYSCSMNSGRTFATCNLNDVSLAAGNSISLTGASYIDAAGNPLENDDDYVAGADSNLLADFDEDSPEISGVSSVCAKLGTGLQKSRGWMAAYGSDTDYADATGNITLALASGSLSITAGSALTGVSANDWTFTIAHERGLVRPTIAVDGTDVTITVDRFFHSGADIARTINGHPTIGRGGLGSVWSASGADALVPAAAIGDVLDTDVSGTPATQSCAITVTLDQPSSVSNGALSVGASTPDDAGEFRVLIGGDAQTDSGAFASSVNIRFASGQGAGNSVQIVVNGTTSTGTVRVSSFLQGFGADDDLPDGALSSANAS